MTFGKQDGLISPYPRPTTPRLYGPFGKRRAGSAMLEAVGKAKKALALWFCPRPTRGRLLADNGNLGVRNFQPHEAVIAIEQKKNFEVGGGDFQAFVGLAVGTGGSGRLHGDRTGGQFLGNDHRKSLHAALGPVIDAREDSVLMIEIVVQNGDERGIECEVLLEGAGPLGGLISAVPLASQPPPDGAISNSSWPTVCPPSLMVSLPLS